MTLTLGQGARWSRDDLELEHLSHPDRLDLDRHGAGRRHRVGRDRHTWARPLDEPPRDHSGYRRYQSTDLLRLVQVRTLAAAGVPLAEIGPLLDADTEQFAAALADVRRRLTDRIEDLIARREMLHRLADGDRVLLPDRAHAILHRLAGLGFTPHHVALYREGLVLAKALFPEDFDDYLTHIDHTLDDARYVDLTKRSWDAETWHPDDPRVDELATALADHLLANPALLAGPTGFLVRDDAATRYGLLNHHREDQAPTWARLTALIETKLRAAGIPVPHQ